MDINPPKYSDIDFINFLIAASNVFSCTEAARCYPFVANAPSHDAFTRCLQRQPPDTEALWDEVKNHVKPEEGFLIVDDSTLDKPYAKEMAFVRRMWSGKHHRTVKLSFLKKSSFRELLRKYVKTTRKINPTIAPPITSSMKCLPRYTLEKAMDTITKGVNILIILLLKTVAIPPHSAVVSATCPEGNPKGERVKAS